MNLRKEVSELPAKLRRAQIYVPGNSIKMIQKSSDFNADSIIFDLEDAVPKNEKNAALRLLIQNLDGLDFKCREICVRINSLPLSKISGELEKISKIDTVDTLVIPKAESSLDEIYHLTGKNTIPLIETPKGLIGIEEIVRSEGVCAVTWGAADLSFSVGGEISAYERNSYVMTKLVMTAGAYGLDAIDKVYFAINNIEGLIEEASLAKSYGYSGKQVIHPAHLEAVEKIFSPSDGQLNWARRVLDAFKEEGNAKKGAVSLNSQLIDQAHVRMAEKILQLNNYIEEADKERV